MGGNKIFKILVIVGLIFAITIFVFYCIKILRRKLVKKYINNLSISKIDALDGNEFEKLLFYLFWSNGLNVQITKKSHDFGADLIITHGREKLIIQSKLYCTKNVGNSAIQEAYTAQKFYNADKCMVITNSEFTNPAKELASKSSVILIDRRKLINLLKEPKINYYSLVC